MRTAIQQELLQTLGQIFDICPELRLGQLVTNLPMLVRQATRTCDIEDVELLEAARKNLAAFVRART